MREDHWSQAADALGKCLKEVGAMPEPVMEAISTLSQRIQRVESHRVLKSRSERSRLGTKAQPIQDAIDAVLFKCYGLTAEEGDYISKRLEEML